MPYHANRGGQAPGHLRDASRDVIEGEALDDALVFDDERQQAWWEQLDEAARVRWLTGHLWNCTGGFPAVDCQLPDLPPGSTHARAARRIRQPMQ